MSINVTAASVKHEFAQGVEFKERIGLFETVAANENFFVGKQWEGVNAGGLPTPVFNFIKRVVLFTVASITGTSTKVHASPMGKSSERVAETVNTELDRLFETNNIDNLIRDLLRNAAVDGDGALFTFWDPENGVRTEVVSNTNVFFGNVNERDVERQPYIIIATREMTQTVRERLRRIGGDADGLRSDTDERGARDANLDDGDKSTVLLRMWRDDATGTIRCAETVGDAMLRRPWDTKLRRYPLVWLPWDYVQDCYHGQAMVSGLLPNQIFINKLFAMSMISLMTTAYPKIVYDRTRVARWDNRVGAAIPVTGGDVNGVAKIVEPAQISPQVSLFIDKAISYTQTFLGATPAALGDVRPDNTSAIIALQRASTVPNELTRFSLYRATEDLARVYLEFMRVCYGVRETDGGEFDFATLKDAQMTLKLDVGASSYWSEIASMQTLDNLFARGAIGLKEYLERVPEGIIPDKSALIEQMGIKMSD
ncbi:MAG: hypothetical protein LBN02_06870 [Oscillospiraceae bacterium]|jgi:hypothetical protein|nr:hypothetical protein [Oscillospiraceae bacterium]